MNEILAHVTFWCSALTVAYSYVGYPRLLKWWAARRVPPCPAQDGPVASLTILFAAHNEEAVIGEKLGSIVASDFPKDHLEVLVGDDRSSDRTREIVRAYGEKHPYIRLVAFDRRMGKPAIINALAAQARADVLVLTDANIIFTPDCFTRIARHFRDPSVRLVAANIRSRNVAANGGISLQEDAYIRREIEIKWRQSVVSGVVIAPFGAGFAIRRPDFSPVPPGASVDDFYIAMQASRLGGRAIQELDAICFENVSHESAEEFRRKVRMSRGNFQNLATFWSVAARPWHPLGFHFISHKVLRWLTPAFIVVSFAACLWLAFGSVFYRGALALMLLAALTPLIDRPFRKAGLHLKPVRFAAYFLEMNLALGVGFVHWAMGRTGSVWQPTRRTG